MILEVGCKNFTIQRSVMPQVAVSTHKSLYATFSAINRINCAATGFIRHF
jgi:hypothetical protein